MMISRKNYEIYFVDYFDGKLDESVKAELSAFLEVNGDLKAEFEQFEKITAKSDSNILFTNKERLKKNIPTLLNYKTWLIAEAESDLNEEQIRLLKQFIQKHPETETERKTFGSVKLIPDEVVFPGKKNLKKGPVIIPLRRNTIISISAAAAVIIFIVGYLFLNGLNKTDKIITDNKENQKPKNESEVAVTTPIDKLVPAGDQKVTTVTQKQTGHVRKGSVRKAKPVQEFTLQNENRKDTLPQINLPEPVSKPVANLPEAPVANPAEDHSLSLTDIFDKDELKALEDNARVKNEEANSFTSVAMKEFSEKTGVSIRKRKTENSVTYALSVKKIFSISHIKAEE